MPNFLKRHWPLIAILIAFVVGSIWTQRGGYLLYGEADHFLIDHNTDQRSWLSKILCPHIQDAENYMARDTAHIIENLDARFVHLCVMAGLPHFLSLSNYVCFAIIASVFWFTAGLYGLSRLTASLLLALLFTTPCIFMSGAAVRPGHVVATTLMVCLAALLYHTHQEHIKARGLRKLLACTFLLSLLMVWTDRQGLVAACAIAVICFFFGHPHRRRLVHCIIAAIAVHMVWYFFIGRRLVVEITPFHDAILPSNILAVSDGHKNLSWSNLAGGFIVVVSNLRFLIGSVPPVLSIGAMAFMGFALRKNWWVVVAVVTIIAAMNFIILGAAQPILWPDILPSAYYHIIGTTALWLLLSYAVFQFDKHRAVPLVLGLLILSNIFSLPGHVATFKNGHLRGFIAGAPFMREALRQTAWLPNGTSTNRYNALESAQFKTWEWIMKNPLEYGGKLSAQEFVESSQYLQFVRSEKHLPFGRGGRKP